VLLSIYGGSDLGLFEINEAATLVAEAAHPDANIIFGAAIDESLGDRVRVTVIAAGFEGREWTEPTQVRVERQAASSEPLFGEREEEEAFEEDDLEIPDFLRT
jgi:cell division protein FtsZ